MGVPVVAPSNTPERIETASGSCRCVVNLDWPGRRAVQPGLDVGFAQGNARRTAIDHAPDRRPVAFAPAGDPEEMAETIVAQAPSVTAAMSGAFGFFMPMMW